MEFEAVQSHGFQAADVVLPAGEAWGLVDGGGERFWSVHALWYGELGGLHLPFGPLRCLLLSDMEDYEGPHCPAVLPEVSILQLFVVAACSILHCGAIV